MAKKPAKKTRKKKAAKKAASGNTSRSRSADAKRASGSRPRRGGGSTSKSKSTSKSESESRSKSTSKGARRSSPLVDTRVVYCGDNLDQLRKLPDNCVDLIYIDPPFNSNRNYEVFWGEAKEKRAFEDRHAGHYVKVMISTQRKFESSRRGRNVRRRTWPWNPRRAWADVPGAIGPSSLAQSFLGRTPGSLFDSNRRLRSCARISLH